MLSRAVVVATIGSFSALTASLVSSIVPMRVVTGIVERNVQPAEVSVGLYNCVPHLFGVGDIKRQGQNGIPEAFGEVGKVRVHRQAVFHAVRNAGIGTFQSYPGLRRPATKK
jgi:hypothetical protein